MKEKKIDKAFISKILWYCTLTLKLRGRIRKRWSQIQIMYRLKQKIKTDSIECYVYLLAVTKLTQSIIGLK